MRNWAKRTDNWFVEQFDRVGFHLQTKLNWHITDIWAVGSGGVLALMTGVMLTGGYVPPLFAVTPYAIMWGFFLAIALPWLARQKRSWSLERVVWWFGWADRLRLTFPPLRLFIFLAVLLFAFGPSIGNYVYGHAETWGRFALTVIRAVITPGGVIFATYLMSIYPAPPENKAQDQERSGLVGWFTKSEPVI